MDRRKFLAGGLAVVSGLCQVPQVQAQEESFWFFDEEPDDVTDGVLRQRRKTTTAKPRKLQAAKPSRPAYKGRTVVAFVSTELPGTIIIKTRERALYRILGSGRAMRYLVAVGKEGFAWAGTANIGVKRVNPTWTPPAAMIRRKPEYAEWAGGMPGGIPENPLGVRAMYLYRNGRDTLFRIHGTNNPASIGTAASSGCIRMLNREVIELYNSTPIGTKVIVS